MNKKGQALIEFIIIIPVFIMVLIGALDLIRINNVKISLENSIDNYINNDESVKNVSIETIDNYKVYSLTEETDVYSPFLSPFLGTKYEVKVERSIYDK